MSNHEVKQENPVTSDIQLIVEEKIVKPDGEVIIKKYSKGRFLGKVLFKDC